MESFFTSAQAFKATFLQFQHNSRSIEVYGVAMPTPIPGTNIRWYQLVLEVDGVVIDGVLPPSYSLLFWPEVEEGIRNLLQSGKL